MAIKLKNNFQTGFTIVETFIVLAVTGVLFVSTSLLIQGQVERHRQQDGAYQLQQLVRDQINNTANGFFNDTSGTDLNIVVKGIKLDFGNSDSGSTKITIYRCTGVDNDNPACDTPDFMTSYTYPQNVTLKSASPNPIYIMFNKTTNNNALGVGLYGDSALSTISPLTTAKYCFTNGSNNTSITIDAGLNVELIMKDSSC